MLPIPPRKQMELKDPEIPAESQGPDAGTIAPVEAAQPETASIALDLGVPAAPEPTNARSGDVEPALDPVQPHSAEPVLLSSPALPIVKSTPPPPTPLPDALLRIQKCEFCGFPVSDGRTLCLDCERLDFQQKESQKEIQRQQRQYKRSEARPGDAKQRETKSDIQENEQPAEQPTALTADEILPPFLANPSLVEIGRASCRERV